MLCCSLEYAKLRALMGLIPLAAVVPLYGVGLHLSRESDQEPDTIYHDASQDPSSFLPEYIGDLA